MTRQFNKMIFLGNGVFSRFESRRLHARLDDGLDLLSGLQQGGDDPDRKFAKEIEDVVKDVAAALLGKEIEIGKEIK